MSAVSAKSEVNSTPKYLNDSVCLTDPHGSRIASLSDSSIEQPKVIQKDFSALSVIPYFVKTSLKMLNMAESSALLSYIKICIF